MRWASRVPARFHNLTKSHQLNARRSLQLHAATSSSSPSTSPDPFKLVAPQLTEVRETLVHLLGSAHPGLDEIAKYYFSRPSKLLRPVLVLLFSQATNGLGRNWDQMRWMAEQEGRQQLDEPLTRRDVLNDYNPHISSSTSAFSSKQVHEPLDTRAKAVYEAPNTPRIPAVEQPFVILPTQLRLAQIVEMIHAASLLHDDVIDDSPLRRGVPSAPKAFGSRLSILGDNFILGRASTSLARLGDPDAIELIASVISNLVEGEILQLKEAKPEKPWTLYLQKTYMKTASLMAKGVRAAVALGGCAEGEIYREVAYAYGRNLGIAFQVGDNIVLLNVFRAKFVSQLVDDILDYEAGEATLGKPGGADLQLGLATGPALYAWEEYPELGPLIRRKFEQPGDVELVRFLGISFAPLLTLSFQARDLVRKSSGLERTKDLAKAYATQAKEVLRPLPDSDAKAALEALTDRVVKRKS